MTKARKLLINPHISRYYHLYNRCVRQAFLMGKDKTSGKDFSHRKRWIAKRLRKLESVFAIRLAGYSLLSDHYHLVVYIDQESSENWPNEEVVSRWARLCRVNENLKRYVRNKGEIELQLQDKYESQISKWRENLSSVSWFMKFFNEYIARKANKEDKKKGKFFESRFKSQALLDGQALLLCMIYVDLNPVRAGISLTPETSQWTSIKQRVEQEGLLSYRQAFTQVEDESLPQLMSFKREGYEETQIPFSFKSYLELIDWMGRIKKSGKRGSIPENLPPILVRLHFSPDHWLEHMTLNGDKFSVAVGTPVSLKTFAQYCEQKWVRGIKISKRLFACCDPV